MKILCVICGFLSKYRNCEIYNRLHSCRRFVIEICFYYLRIVLFGTNFYIVKNADNECY